MYKKKRKRKRYSFTKQATNDTSTMLSMYTAQARTRKLLTGFLQGFGYCAQRPFDLRHLGATKSAKDISAQQNRR